MGSRGTWGVHSELAGSPRTQRPVLPGKPLPSKGSGQMEDSGVEGPDPTCLLSTETGPAMPGEGALLIEFLRGIQDWWGGAKKCLGKQIPPIFSALQRAS